ncbi:Hypothetical predicted protein [Mytilus galloprovincialis]|uniref:AAA+ ATPase domain-containing protein n=1 Tax=Mytilus galloprovincialis TaxID=29158 RepID=A0A8B6C6Z8_MYTGA|nr:Hypothetical predicted protein [Mytilus galloprovincialis]
MVDIWKKESLLKYQSPTSIFIVGASNSGKTVYTKNMLEHADEMFQKPPTKIYYCFSVWQPIYDEMKTNIKNIEFHKGLPEMDILSEWGAHKGHKILVLDDLMMDSADSSELVHLMCVGSHHHQITVIYILQNLFHKGKAMRTASLNCHYFILFRNYRDQLQVQTLGKQIFPGQSKYFIDSYHKATSVKFRPLIIDLNAHTDKTYQLTTNRGVEQFPIVYLPKQ